MIFDKSNYDNILYGNLDSSNEEVDKSIEEASKLFYKGSYSQAVNLLIKAIGKEDVNVSSRFIVKEEEN